MHESWLAVTRTAMAGAMVMVVMGLTAGTAAAETKAGAQMAATPPADRTSALDPEKETVALPPRRDAPSSANGPAFRRNGAFPAGSVRVGQGLRPDGTELVPNEVSRPWLIRQ